MAIILLLLAGYAHLKYAFLAQLALADNSRRPPAFSRSQTDPVALTALARQGTSYQRQPRQGPLFL